MRPLNLGNAAPLPGGQEGLVTPQQESTPSSEGETVPVQETGDPGEGEREGEGTPAGEEVSEKEKSSTK